KEIREMVVFALQDIIKDPPFSKLDLISCRNLLIYMGPELQKRLLPLFHYILKPDGILFLGPSETIGSFVDLFSVFNKEGRFFKRKEVASSVEVRVDFPTMSLVNNLTESQKEEAGEKVKDVSVGKLAERILLDTYAPASVIINENYDILYFYGRTGKYLEPAPGEADLNILEMARQGLKYKLRSCIRCALSKKADVIEKGLRVKTNGKFQMIDLIVKPIKAPKSRQKLMMIIFEDVVSPKHLESIEAAPVSAEGPDQHVTELEQELECTKENLQTTIEELETSNEELKSTNEEMQSTNEELQSSNEELETSKEELQSLNEELTTVNTELHGKIDELSETNNDMKNLLESTYIPIIFLNNDLSIKRFTREATKVIHLIQTDIGRPVGDIASNLIDENNEDLICDTAQVLKTLSSREKEVQTKDGHRYLMRIRPYRTTNNVIDGVVITFVDIHERKTAKEMSQ
ncbi:PAS domain-containing protein, partial [bacterium]|nr:PAS domain-containing protein [bacterium]